MNSEIKPYNTNAGKKAEVQIMFDNVASNYDFLNRLLSLGIDRGWRKTLIKKMKETRPYLILDMATGTADLAIMTAQRIPASKVIGVDLSKNMIDVGYSKIVKAGVHKRVKLQLGDSENIDFPNGHFDAAMVAFGVRNFENLDKGLAELYRVVKKDAALYVLEFSRPTIFPVKQVFNIYFKWVVPTLGRIFSKDKRAYTYLYDSVQAFPDYDNFTARMERAGFTNTSWKALSFGICCLYIGVKP